MKINDTLASPTNTWFTSDLHYGHGNICRGVSKWELKEESARNFETVHDMNDCIIDGINSNVKSNDILIILGDLCFGNPYNLYILKQRIICDNILIILGNHDKNLRDNKAIKTDHGIEYPQNLFPNIDSYKKIAIEKQDIVMCHYAFRVWDGGHRGTWNLHGHSHSTLPPMGKQLDVGVDNAIKILGEYRPFSFEEVRDIMNLNETVFLDHHIEITD